MSGGGCASEPLHGVGEVLRLHSVDLVPAGVSLRAAPPRRRRRQAPFITARVCHMASKLGGRTNNARSILASS